MNRKQIIPSRTEVLSMAREAGFSQPWTAPKETQERLERFAALIASRVAVASASVEREACIDIIETYRIPVGNSAAGEMACEWTYDALHQIRDDIRARNNNEY